MPFGKSIGTNIIHFGFASENTEIQLEITYYNYRDYSLDFGRWNNRDLLFENGGINLYCFIMNSPIDYIDHLGMACCGENEYDSKIECCIDNKIQAKVTDDAGRLCCPNVISKIYIRSQRGVTNDPIKWGHTFIEIDEKGYGFYIGNIVHDDTDEPYDDALTYEYNACPVTKVLIIQAIWDDKNPHWLPPLYTPLNIIGYNCSGKACYWLEKGGIQAPFPPDTPTLLPVQGDKDKQFYPGREPK